MTACEELRSACWAICSCTERMAAVLLLNELHK